MIRQLTSQEDVAQCLEIVRENWGADIAATAHREMLHALPRPYSMEWPPVYYVDERDGRIVGFAGLIPSWEMTGIYSFIWINVQNEYQSQGIGKALTEHRIEEVRKRGGTAIHLMTQKPDFFYQFGFEHAYLYDNDWRLMALRLGAVKL